MITTIFVQPQTGTDGYELIAEHDDGTQSDLPGWFGDAESAAERAHDDYPGAEIVVIEPESEE